MGKKSILYIGNFMLPDKNAAAQRVLGNAKIFAMFGYRVILVGPGIKDELNSVRKRYKEYDFEIYFVEQNFFKKVSSIWDIELVESIIKNNNNIKAVICYNYRSIAMYRILKLCREKSIICIADTTEWYEPHGNILTWLVAGMDTLFRMKIIHPRMDALIPTSKYLYDYYKKYNIPMVILPTLVDTNEFPALVYRAHARRKFVYFGSAGPTKDRLDVIIKIFARVLRKKPNANFVFIILGMEEMECKKIFHDFDIPVILRNHIDFRGKLKRPEVLSIVSSADFSIFLRPNNRTCKAGFPTKFSESLACGIPVITNLSSDLRLYLEEGENGWVIDPDDLDASAEKIISLMAIPAKELFLIKQKCAESKRMDYKNFAAPVKDFLEGLSI